MSYKLCIKSDNKYQSLTLWIKFS